MNPVQTIALESTPLHFGRPICSTDDTVGRSTLKNAPSGYDVLAAMAMIARPHPEKMPATEISNVIDDDSIYRLGCCSEERAQVALVFDVELDQNAVGAAG